MVHFPGASVHHVIAPLSAWTSCATVRSAVLKPSLTSDRPEESNEARDARTSLDIHSTRLEKLLIATAKHFITSLLDSTTGSGPGLQAVLTLLDSGEEGWWSARSRFGWWKEFVRRYEVGLRELRGSVEDSLNAQEVEGRAGELVKAVWKGVMGDE